MDPSFLISIVSGEAADMVQRARRNVVEYLLAGFLGLCGLGFMLVGGYILAARYYGDMEAAFGLGAVFLVFAVAVLLYHRISARIRARRIRERRAQEAKGLASTAMLALLPILLSRRGGLASMLLPAVGAVGYAIFRENSVRRRARRKDADET